MHSRVDCLSNGLAKTWDKETTRTSSLTLRSFCWPSSLWSSKHHITTLISSNDISPNVHYVPALNFFFRLQELRTSDEKRLFSQHLHFRLNNLLNLIQQSCTCSVAKCKTALKTIPACSLDKLIKLFSLTSETKECLTCFAHLTLII